ncbi:MAG: UDP-glucose 4-epimerase GalE [Proteobacteria bacterium]|nr:UDP-glucose 4-epimerase GalE [Pseudomonadota bacterium]MCH8092818.1 UDP-glucose 4-epimerase GalE [Pseudomonadota bacterium]
MPKDQTVLVTGGAGYIGGHVLLALIEAGMDAVVIDDLSTGQREAVPEGVRLIEGSVGDAALLEEVMDRYRVEAVIHLAGSIVVPESVRDPLAYYRNNTLHSATLIETCVRLGVNHFIYSSSAAVYGEPDSTPIPEDAPTRPINPYGTSKLMTEWILRDTAKAHDFHYAALRYFNVAGADAEGRAGQSSPVATHLIKIACQTALGSRSGMKIYGDDYETPDGTCIRDYVHVTDLADVHVRALGYLAEGGGSVTLNCGYGHGYSVREVLRTLEDIIGRPLPAEISARRAGDTAVLTAAAGRVRDLLGWEPKYDDLRVIVDTALAWERRIAATAAGKPVR